MRSTRHAKWKGLVACTGALLRGWRLVRISLLPRRRAQHRFPLLTLVVQLSYKPAAGRGQTSSYAAFPFNSLPGAYGHVGGVMLFLAVTFAAVVNRKEAPSACPRLVRVCATVCTTYHVQQQGPETHALLVLRACMAYSSTYSLRGLGKNEACAYANVHLPLHLPTTSRGASRSALDANNP